MKNSGNTIRIAVTLIAILLSVMHIMAQTPNVPNVPPTPQAVAFNRLGDYQVNNNYGAPDISIPLFEIDFHGYKIPLALHYEATPIKPGYNYDVTGLGWTLSGNSCVSRTIKDRADENGGPFNNPFTLDSFEDHSGRPKRYIDYKNQLDQLNFQYDSYNIVLPSGRTIPFFMYIYDGAMQYLLMSLDSYVKISCTYGQNSIESFTVTDENGVIYHFNDAELSTNGYDNDYNALKNVTWLLSSIEIPTKGTITYTYNAGLDIHTQNNISEPVLRVSRFMSQMIEDATEKRFDVMKSLQSRSPRYRMKFIKSINYGPTSVAFNYEPDGMHMKEIVISDNGETIRKYTLNIGGSSQYGSCLSSLVISGQDDTDELVYGFGYKNQNLYENDSIVRYTDYWGNICCSNKNKDLGNFNMFFNIEEDGRMILNRQGLIEQLASNHFVQLIDNKDEDPYYYYKIKLQSKTDGETREPISPEYHKVLSSIIYPNGGHTDFNYENHRFPTASAADGDLVFDRRRQRIVEGGGFRIKSIINYSADGAIASEDHYRYGFTLGDIIHRNFPLPLPDTLDIDNLSFNDTINRHIGCGEAVVDPNLLTFMNFTYYNIGNHSLGFCSFQNMAIGLNSSVRNMIDIQGGATWWDAYFSANTFRSLIGDRRPVVYPEVTVYHGNPDMSGNCNSKTVYKYDIYSFQHDPYTYYLSSFNKTTLPDTAYFERLCYDSFSDAPEMINDFSKAAKRHQLKMKSDYSYDDASHTWNLMSEEKYYYNEEKISKTGYVFNSWISREYRSNYYSSLGNKQWLEDTSLSDFYIPNTQSTGRHTLGKKETTILRQGGTHSRYNTLSEEYSYLYHGVLKSRKYSDKLKHSWSFIYDKVDLNSYIGEENGTGIVSDMQDRNMLNSLTYAEKYTSLNEEPSELLSGSKIDYGYFGNNILPSKLYESNGEQYEESIEILSYDSYGNPTEIVDLKTGDVNTGTHSVFVWDAYGRYMIAMIKNATLAQIGNLAPLQAATSQSRHSMLQTLLPNAQVQTWDYMPLVGVSSHTDVDGQTILYEYDGLGRLKSEKRVVNGTADPETLHEYEYNYLNP